MTLPTPGDGLLETRAVCAGYGATAPIIQNIELSLAAGEAISVIGPSGSGKSTLLRVLSLLQLPSAGQIHLLGQLAADGPELAFPPVRYRRVVGMVHQELHLWPNRTVMANLTEAPRFVLGASRSEAEDRARMWLERVGVGAWAGRFPHELSGGQRQRVAIARCLIMEPRIVLFDEITSGLDVRSVAHILELLQSLREPHRAFVIVSHHLTFARAATDRTLILIDGRVVESGPSRKVIEEPQSSEARRFLDVVRSLA